MKYVILEFSKDKNQTNPTVFGPYETYEKARLACHARIALAINEDWGLETNECILDIFTWKILTLNSL